MENKNYLLIADKKGKVARKMRNALKNTPITIGEISNQLDLPLYDQGYLTAFINRNLPDELIDSWKIDGIIFDAGSFARAMMNNKTKDTIDHDLQHMFTTAMRMLPRNRSDGTEIDYIVYDQYDWIRDGGVFSYASDIRWTERLSDLGGEFESADDSLMLDMEVEIRSGSPSGAETYDEIYRRNMEQASKMPEEQHQEDDGYRKIAEAFANSESNAGGLFSRHGYDEDDYEDPDDRLNYYKDRSWDGRTDRMRLSDESYRALIRKIARDDVEQRQQRNAAAVRTKKGLFGNKKEQLGMESTTRAPSAYMESLDADGDAYTIPEQCPIIAVWGSKGGIGKTSIATCLAQQLSWWFNKPMLTHKAKNIAAKILTMSVDEFDDSIWYGLADDPEKVSDSNRGNKGIMALRDKVRDQGEACTWDDILPCLEISKNSALYYLPNPTPEEVISTSDPVKLDEYKLIIDILREIFDFIIIDMPDNLLYQGRLMRAVLEMADATVVVTTPIISAIDNLQHTMAARYSNERAVPIDPKYSILAINKYITPSNQYRKGYAGGSLTMNQIAESLSASFFEVVPISLTEEAAIGSLLDGRDITFKQDIAKLADSVLMLIDYRYDEEDRS